MDLVFTRELPEAPSVDRQLLQETFSRIAPSVVRIEVEGNHGVGYGSGVVLRSDGTIATNVHVIQSADTITVTLNDGRRVPAAVEKVDADHDIAILKLDDHGGKAPKPAKIRDSNTVYDEQTHIVGFPKASYFPVISPGVCSRKGSILSGLQESPGNESPELIGNSDRTSFCNSDRLLGSHNVQPGNSGGPMCDNMGRVVGLCSMGTSRQTISVPSTAITELLTSADNKWTIKNSYKSEFEINPGRTAAKYVGAAMLAAVPPVTGGISLLSIPNDLHRLATASNDALHADASMRSMADILCAGGALMMASRPLLRTGIGVYAASYAVELLADCLPTRLYSKIERKSDHRSLGEVWNRISWF